MAEGSIVSEFVCADCGEDEIFYVDTFYNVGICKHCCEVHKKLKTTDDHIKYISEVNKGSIQNDSVNLELEKFLPSIPIKQGKGMHEAIRRKFIFEKYNKQTFATESLYNSSESSKCKMSGYLLKKGKQGDRWKYRFFVLQNGILEYFLDNQSVPKSSLQVNKLSMLIQTLENHSYQLTMNYLPESSTSRTYYLTFTAVNELYNWYFAILSAQLFEIVAPEVAIQTSTQVKSGFVYKIGTGKFDRWRKRWVTLNKGHFMYFSNEQSPYPKGEFDILTKEQGFDIKVGEVGHIVPAPNQHTFIIVTPTRAYKFCAENQMELVAWTDVIRSIILQK
ncbi:Arf-GAP with dual PH domain-containing protein 1-like [Oopsacas minuta]|uniref:Arf-GAP with dual PH domain-containing protein 1-like n=1 Tax=Oopsacas minuta TaxID=111878 RepID=A0AAV7JLS7_9METZ|nr:Arf-GAP with dual PH domain-containing protein 1-like [Oopsacas minuta]